MHEYFESHAPQGDEKTVTLDPNGGTCVTTTVTLIYGVSSGDLPIAQRDGFTFLGWYTEKEGGVLVPNQAEVFKYPATTLYARWGKPAYSYGDVNMDGSINLTDVVLIQKALADLVKLTDEQMILADVDGTDEYSLVDVTLIQKFIAELITVFPIEENGGNVG